MRRREVVRLLIGAAAWPFATRAEQINKVPRIGLLLPNSAAAHAKDGCLGAFMDGLGGLGYLEGKTILIDGRFADGKLDRVPRLAAELVANKVGVIVTAGEPVYTIGRVITSVPIVAMTTGDLVALGLAQSLARPGGNVTGASVLSSETDTKKLELLKEVIPSMRRAGLLIGRDGANLIYAGAIAEAAKAMNLELQLFEASDASSYEAAFSSASATSIDGFVIANVGIFYGDIEIIASIANHHGVPTVGRPYFAESGLLLGYGVDYVPMCRRAAVFVDKILKGAKPGDIPIEQATKFKTVVNLKTAEALGVGIPPIVLAAADEVIE